MTDHDIIGIEHGYQDGTHYLCINDRTMGQMEFKVPEVVAKYAAAAWDLHERERNLAEAIAASDRAAAESGDGVDVVWLL